MPDANGNYTPDEVKGLLDTLASSLTPKADPPKQDPPVVNNPPPDPPVVNNPPVNNPPVTPPVSPTDDRIKELEARLEKQTQELKQLAERPPGNPVDPPAPKDEKPPMPALTDVEALTKRLDYEFKDLGANEDPLFRWHNPNLNKLPGELRAKAEETMKAGGIR